MTNYTEILDKLNYPYLDCGNYIKSVALYRGGNSMGSLVIYKSGSGGNNGGKVVDFVTSQTYSFEDFIKLASGDNNVKIEELLSKVVKVENKEPKITTPQIFDKNILNTLIPDHAYWTGRGISREVILRFKGGVCLEGKLKNRYVFPIFSSENIVGFSARDLTGNSNSKWKILGNRNNFCYPLFLNSKDIIRDKYIYIVEGIGDVLSLFECGISNCVCIFGTYMGIGLLNYLLKANPSRIFISLNSDVPGAAAAVSLKHRLYKYFDKKQIAIIPPETNSNLKDFNDLLVNNKKNNIIEWHERNVSKI